MILCKGCRTDSLSYLIRVNRHSIHSCIRFTLWAGLLLILFPAQARDAFDFSAPLQAAYSDIQKLRIGAASTLLKAERKKGTGNGFIPYLESYADFFYYLVTDDQKSYNQHFAKKQDARLQEIAALSDKSPYQRMLMAEVRLHSAFVKLKFGNRTSGGWDIIRANRLLSENARLFPDFVPHLKTLGLLHVMIGSVPEEYQWVARLMGLRGDIALGLKELAEVEKKSPVFAREARVVSLLLKAYMLSPDEFPLPELRELPYREPDNLLFHFLSASVLMKRGESRSAQEILDKAPLGGSYLDFPFLHYMKAELALYAARYTDAQTGFQYFIDHSQGINFVKDALFKQFLSQWLKQGEISKELLDKIVSTGAQNVEADKHAQRMAERFLRGEISGEQRILFKARYAFDGGYLTDAENLLRPQHESSFAHLHSRIEYNYRMGRILQQQHKWKEAIPFLTRAVTLNQGYDYYYGPSAALQLGYIYQDLGQPDQAVTWFEKALSFKKHEYKNSIDNKARAALTRIRGK